MKEFNFRNLYEIVDLHRKKHPRKKSHIYIDHYGREVQVSYRNFVESIDKVSSGLISLGVGPGSKLALIANTSYEWSLIDFAIVSIGAVDIPRGTDTPSSELENILTHSEPEYLVIETYSDLLLLVPEEQWNKYKKIIILKRGVPYQRENIITLYDLFELGDHEYEKNEEKLKKYRSEVTWDTLATIIYTSGTTGKAKGVMLSHGNFLQNVKITTPPLKVGFNDSWLSVLPVWHAFERAAEYVAYYNGNTIYFTNLTRVGNDIREFKPQYLCAVPKLWISVKDKILSEVNKKSPVAQKLFHWALRARQGYIINRLAWKNQRFIRKPEELHPSLAQRWPYLLKMMLFSIPAGLGFLLFGSVRKKLGGKFKALVSGGGSLPLEVDLFYWGIGIPIINAYGATEMGPGISGRSVDNLVLGTVGPPLPETTVSIRDEQGRIMPKGEQGEIWAKGKQMMQGYYKEPELTKEVLTEDGWYRTGDLGILSYNDHIKITGRIKSMIVLLSGENVFPEPIEETLQQSPFIQMSMLVGQDKRHLGALIVPFFENIKDYLEKQGGIAKDKLENMDEVLNLPHIREMMEAEINKLINKNPNFKPFERIKNFKIIPKEFQVGEELTQTMKVKRHYVQQKYKQFIDEIFGEFRKKEDSGESDRKKKETKTD
ncbi:MAG: long-chain fatty acid--CoA ligase [Calditrichia bacterium]